MNIKRFHTTMSLGDTRHVTPEGFLVCQDVPMARIGDMLYGPDETPVHSADGVSGVTIRRDPDEVFRQDTILSILGKPVTNDHPDELVTPGTWRQHAVGTVMSARRGEGAMADLLIGDIMITEPQAIQDVLSGKVEVSCGYDAEYEEERPGFGRQKNIVYNHLALVDKGRCGPRCAIGDYQPPQLETRTMARAVIKDKKSFTARLRALMNSGVAVKDADIEEALEKEGTSDEVSIDPGVSGMGEVHIHMSGGPGGGTNTKAAGDDLGDPDPAAVQQQQNQIDPAIEARFQGIETALTTISAAVQKLAGAGEEEEENAEAMAEEIGDKTPEEMTAAKDSAFFRDTFQDTLSMAEVIVPGVRVPAFDAKAKPGRTYDALCKFRRTVLDLAWTRPETAQYLRDIVGNAKTLDRACPTCDKVRTVFKGLWLARRHDNNGHATNDSRREPVGDYGAVRGSSPIKSPADLNKFNAERRAKNSNRAA
jgi:hypothetical protein